MRPYVPEGWTGEFLGVGEAPGDHEDKKSRRPFTGPAGSLLMKFWQQAGFAPEQLALTNSVRCRPKGNATPTLTQIRACRPFVLDAIQKLQPRMIIAIGLTALKSLLNSGSLSIVASRGREFRVPNLEASPPVIVTYHPSVVLRGDAEKIERILEDFRHIGMPELTPLTIGMPSGRILGLDTEYGKNRELFTIGISDGTRAIATELSGSL